MKIERDTMRSLFTPEGEFMADDSAPMQESMRGGRRTPNAPSTDQKRVRRQLTRRSDLATQGTFAFEEVDWDDVYPHIPDEGIHRGLGANLPDELHRYVHDDSVPTRDRAHALIRHISGERGGGDHRYGLGMHWSMNQDVAEGFGEESAKHYAESADDPEGAHPWGTNKGDIDHGEVKDHLHSHHGIHPHHLPPSIQGTQELHERLHKPPPEIPGQLPAFEVPEGAHVPSKANEPFREPDTAKSKPGTAIVIHGAKPNRDDIETNIYGNPNAGGDVYHPFGHGEEEIPLRAGAQVPIRQIAWRKVHTDEDHEDEHENWTHHAFDTELPHREAALHLAAWGSEWGDDYSPSNWDEAYPKEPEKHRVHRSIKVYPSFDLWKHMGGGTGMSHEEVAHKVLDHVRKQPNLGLHWTDDESHAYRVAGHANWGMNRSWHSDQKPAERESDLGASVILHAHWPKREHIETDPDLLKSYNVGGYGNDGMDDEFEVPIKTGSPVKITGISWSQYDQPRKGDFKHHSFETPETHTANKTATVLNTQTERLNRGDQIRTPTGQTSEVKGVRPHETDSSLMYLDTDMGTSTVKRGTDFQVIPKNSQQQELPDIGNPMGGNSGQLPGAGRGAGGGGMGNKQLDTKNTACPNCGNPTLHLQGGSYVCSTCGFTVSAGGSPGNLIFTNQPHGYMPARRTPGPAPKAHVWGARYTTNDDHSDQIVRHARRVLEEGDRA